MTATSEKVAATSSPPADDGEGTRLLSLHDELTLGGFMEVGDDYLRKDPSQTTAEDASSAPSPFALPSPEEAQRLPALLRLLSAARPLSSVPSLGLELVLGEDEGDDNASGDGDGGKRRREEEIREAIDPVIQQAVDRLEDRAALYSAAEGVEFVACQLAPRVTRKLSKVPSLVRGGDGGGSPPYADSAGWQTDALEVAASNPLTPSAPVSSSAPQSAAAGAAAAAKGGKKKKRRKGDSGAPVAPDEDGDEYEDDNDLSDVNLGELADDVPGNAAAAAGTEQTSRKRPPGRLRESIVLFGSEDSLESTATKTLSELALLVVQSLKTAPPTDCDYGVDGGGDGDDGAGNGGHKDRDDDEDDAAAGRGAATSKADTRGGGVGGQRGRRKDKNASGSGGNADGAEGNKVGVDTTTAEAPERNTSSSDVNTAASRLVIPIDDAILSEARRGGGGQQQQQSSSDDGGASKTSSSCAAVGAMIGCDLPSTVAALMHHVPVLRHSHVAVRNEMQLQAYWRKGTAGVSE